ncbi:MAG: gephyrin-like molybdotransferase Glp [Pseudomonadota bacterium]
MTKAPPLRDDCFAMPRGVEWVPVVEALNTLKGALHPIVDTEELTIERALGRVLAEDVVAKTSHPPFTNAAVDGYGFLHAALPKAQEVALPLIDGRAAAGAAFNETVPPGAAIRILTGAKIPNGVDTVILEEDVALADGQVHFQNAIKAGANTRSAGEDFAAGDVIIRRATKLRPDHLGVLASAGVSHLTCYRALRIALFATGDELIGTNMGTDKINDANRPMLAALLQSMGHEVIDLGIIKDDAKAVQNALDRAAEKADAILTTGGASAGEEDHISKILASSGNLQTWRVAIKPGRPIAMALWKGKPVFGLPGNPVAAFVCTVIFAAPAFRVLSGGAWQVPAGYKVPAAFEKSKKYGREEYLRARLNSNGAAEVFKSEGSGRISGLAWSDGLVRLDHEAAEIKNGDLVTYLPYSLWLE